MLADIISVHNGNMKHARAIDFDYTTSFPGENKFSLQKISLFFGDIEFLIGGMLSLKLAAYWQFIGRMKQDE